MSDLSASRDLMVSRQIAARGVRDPAVLAAMGSVPREAFVPDALAEFAYQDSPLPIEEGQTISQPYIVAAMIAALAPKPGDSVLEVGTGSGYAAAVLSRIVRRVYTIERLDSLARAADQRCSKLGYHNVTVRVGDGTLGWPEQAPFDGIVAAAGGLEAPPALLAQLAIGGRLVIPLGPTPREQELLLITRTGQDEYRRQSLGRVRFVPLIGAAGWSEGETPPPAPVRVAPLARAAPVVSLLRETGEAIESLESAPMDALLERIGDARLVLLGEASHGSAEFYRMRARITRALIERKGFTVVALEADWPDAARVNRYIGHLPPARPVPPLSPAFRSGCGATRSSGISSSGSAAGTPSVPTRLGG